jgi:hypothetical protein
VNAAASQAAPFLRRSVAWLIDATVLSLLATVFTWRWIAPAANASVASMSALARSRSRDAATARDDRRA